MFSSLSHVRRSHSSPSTTMVKYATALVLAFTVAAALAAEQPEIVSNNEQQQQTIVCKVCGSVLCSIKKDILCSTHIRTHTHTHTHLHKTLG